MSNMKQAIRHYFLNKYITIRVSQLIEKFVTGQKPDPTMNNYKKWATGSILCPLSPIFSGILQVKSCFRKYQNTWHLIPQDGIFHCHCHKNLKSYKQELLSHFGFCLLPLTLQTSGNLKVKPGAQTTAIANLKPQHLSVLGQVCCSKIEFSYIYCTTQIHISL